MIWQWCVPGREFLFIYPSLVKLPMPVLALPGNCFIRFMPIYTPFTHLNLGYNKL